METFAHLLLLVTFAAVITRRKWAVLSLFLCSLIFTLWVFSRHANDTLNLNF